VCVSVCVCVCECVCVSECVRGEVVVGSGASRAHRECVNE
jgi:hypothetical protein